MHTHRGKPEVNPRHSSLRAARLALGVPYWDLRLIIKARLKLPGSSCPHLPASGITSACHMPDVLCTVSFPTVTTELQVACLLSSPSSPSYSQSVLSSRSLIPEVSCDPEPQPAARPPPLSHPSLLAHASHGLLPSVLFSSGLVAQNPSSPAFCIPGLLLDSLLLYSTMSTHFLFHFCIYLLLRQELV